MLSKSNMISVTFLEVNRNIKSSNWIEVRIQGNLQKLESVYSIHMRIHHRIGDPLKHLLQTLGKQTEMLSKSNMISVTFLEVNRNIKSSNWFDVRNPQKVTGSRKRLFTTCENSSQNLGCSKTST